MNNLKSFIRSDKLPTELPLNQAVLIYLKRLALLFLVTILGLGVALLLFTPNGQLVGVVSIILFVLLELGALILPKRFHRNGKEGQNIVRNVFAKFAESAYEIRNRGFSVEPRMIATNIGYGFSISISLSFLIIFGLVALLMLIMIIIIFQLLSASVTGG